MTLKPVFFLYTQKREEEISAFPKLMYLAGFFDVWHDDSGNSIYSYSILTFNSDFRLKWLQDRTPAVLENRDQIEKWLNYEEYDAEKAFQVITPPEEVRYHQVSNHVNYSSNKSEKCIKPVSLYNESSENNPVL